MFAAESISLVSLCHRENCAAAKLLAYLPRIFIGTAARIRRMLGLPTDTEFTEYVESNPL